MNDEWTTVSVKKKKDKAVVIPSEPHPLHDTWVFWFHDLVNNQWTLPTYTQLLVFNTVEDFLILHNNIKDINSGMFYLMRQGYPPIWDDPLNIKGGGWTFRVDKKDAYNFWVKLSSYCVGETISNTPDHVVGVSISPKMRNVTIRLWTKNVNRSVEQFERVSRLSSREIDFSAARFLPNTEANK
jgi:hypothetical protein